MQFIHDDFELKIKLQNSGNSIGEDYIKNMEFIFCDEKKFDNELKKIGGNINKNKENIEVLEKIKEIKLTEGFSEYKKSNIFYDYNNIIFEINEGYQIKLIDKNIDGKGFLEDISEEDNEVKKYKLGYTLENNNSDEVFGFWGFVRFEIYKGNKKYTFAPFFKTKNLEEDDEVKDMVEEIKKEMMNSLLSYKSISNFGYKIKNARNNSQQLWEFINIFNEIYKDLEKSINDIYENPKYINKTIHQYKKYNSGKIVIDNRLINHSINKGFIKNGNLDIFGRIIPQKTVEGDYNNIPNKVFIDLLQNITKKLDNFLKVGKKSRLQEEQLKKVREKKNILKGKRTSFINKYDLNIVKLGNYSLDFQYLDSKYKKFVINYLKLFFLLDLLNGEILIENKSIDQIYEYWTLIKIRDMFYDLLEGKSKRDIFKLKKVKDNLVFEIGDKPVIINGKDGDCKIVYKFQKEVSSIGNKSGKKKIDDIRIISSNCKPDIFVELHNKQTEEEKYIIFDAKYSTDEIGNIYKKRFENLYKYKAGIVKCNNLQWNDEIKEWVGDMKPIINKVLAIYPGVSEEKLAKLYKKSIDEIDFGGLVLRRGEDKDVKEFVSKLL